MRITQNQIVNGIMEYIQQEVLPQMNGDKAVQIVLSVAVNAIKANKKMVDAIFSSDLVKTILQDDGAGTYEIDGIMDAIYKSVEKYGYFPVTVPQIPLISPKVIEIKLNGDDVAALRRKIENAEDSM